MITEKRIKTAVLSCGNGDHTAALLSPLFLDETAGLELSGVLTDDPDSPASKRVRESGRPLCVIDRGMFPTQRSFDRALFDKLDDLDIELVVMAEWPYALPEDILRRWARQILCLYPELRRNDAQQIRLSACLLETDGTPGAVLLEKTMAIEPEDTPAGIARRVAEAGQTLLPRAVEMFCSGRLCIHGRKTRMLPPIEAQRP